MRSCQRAFTPGVAAADVIRCAALGKHAKGDDHGQAVGQLKTVDHVAAKHLDVLLTMKTRAGYSHQPVTAADRTRSLRAATTLVQIAKSRAGPWRCRGQVLHGRPGTGSPLTGYEDRAISKVSISDDPSSPQ